MQQLHESNGEPDEKTDGKSNAKPNNAKPSNAKPSNAKPRDYQGERRDDCKAAGT